MRDGEGGVRAESFEVGSVVEGEECVYLNKHVYMLYPCRLVCNSHDVQSSQIINHQGASTWIEVMMRRM